eukprot:4354029-Pleurochrysis_carterae.AAC.4
MHVCAPNVQLVHGQQQVARSRAPCCPHCAATGWLPLYLTARRMAGATCDATTGCTFGSHYRTFGSHPPTLVQLRTTPDQGNVRNMGMALCARARTQRTRGSQPNNQSKRKVPKRAQHCPAAAKAVRAHTNPKRSKPKATCARCARRCVHARTRHARAATI